MPSAASAATRVSLVCACGRSHCSASSPRHGDEQGVPNMLFPPVFSGGFSLRAEVCGAAETIVNCQLLIIENLRQTAVSQGNSKEQFVARRGFSAETSMAVTAALEREARRGAHDRAAPRRPHADHPGADRRSRRGRDHQGRNSATASICRSRRSHRCSTSATARCARPSARCRSAAWSNSGRGAARSSSA